jgi:hypothetical protein
MIIDWRKVRRRAVWNPEVIKTEAEALWKITPDIKPVNAESRRVPVAFRIRFLNRVPVSCLRFRLIILNPIKNKPSPQKMVPIISISLN